MKEQEVKFVFKILSVFCSLYKEDSHIISIPSLNCLILNKISFEQKETLLIIV